MNTANYRDQLAEEEWHKIIDAHITNCQVIVQTTASPSTPSATIIVSHLPMERASAVTVSPGTPDGMDPSFHHHRREHQMGQQTIHRQHQQEA